MLAKVVPVAVLAASTILCGCVVEERVAYVHFPPPPEAAEVVAVAPTPDRVYIRGHWEWEGSRYVWVGSRYIRRPNPHAAWVEAHWQSSPRGWYWQNGHWAESHKAKVSGTSTPFTTAPSVTVQGSSPEVQVEVEPAQPQTAAPAGLPPAPTYMPPPPPANPPAPPSQNPPPSGAAPVPQRYLVPSAEY
jgi:hypothetical protein